MKIASIILPIVLTYFLMSCNPIQKKEKESSAVQNEKLQPMVFEAYQNEMGNILYLSDNAIENSIHLRFNGQEFILEKDGDGTKLSDGAITLIRKNDSTILKIDSQIVFKQYPKIISGLLNLGFHENSIMDCETGYAYWINDKTGKLKGIYDDLVEDKKQDYNPIFVKIKTIDRGMAKAGPEASFSSVYDVIEILSSRKASGKDCN